jgi:hypothetical protein
LFRARQKLVKAAQRIARGTGQHSGQQGITNRT